MSFLNLNKNKLELYIYGLLFGLLAVFIVHNFDSVGEDIGRHLKTGEIIWQTKSVPTTNLFSFTEPDFPFINHHWLSEVIFYGVYNLGGFTALIWLKVFVVIAAFLLLFFTLKPLWIIDIASRLSTGWAVIIPLLLSIFIFISRTEVRPEIFSFAILAFFLWVLFRAKYGEKHKTQTAQNTNKTQSTDPEKHKQRSPYFYLWFLPVAQLFWVNLHIYFFIGPLIFAFFIIDQMVGKNKFSIFNFQFSKLLLVGGLIGLATLINPAGIQGALLPFNILKEYGYSIVENQTLFFLADFFGFNLPIFVFKVSVAVLVVSFLLTIKKAKQRIFEILLSAFFIYAGFKMLRNLPLYALASFPVMAVLLTDVVKTYNLQLTTHNKKINNILKTVVAGSLILMIYFVASGGYYKWARLSKEVGFSVPDGLERAVNFVKENNIEGPMFNNFDIGGYLIWKLPEEKVFVDNRPEAYSVKFFSEIYKPMQEGKEKWAEFSEKYGINFIFFAHTDATPWGQDFLEDIVKDPNWKIVYINGDAIVLVKNNKINSEIVSRFSITEKNAISKTAENIKNLNQDPVKLKTDLSRFFYNINWHEPSVYFADEVIKVDPQNPHPYLHKGLVHAFYADKKSQRLAAENIKKAIDLGLKDSRYYFILGGIYMNLGRLDEARLLFEKAVDLDKNNTQAKEFLNKYFK